jgi:hypothetical protein
MLGRKERDQLELFISGSLRQLVPYLDRKHPEANRSGRVRRCGSTGFVDNGVHRTFATSDGPAAIARMTADEVLIMLFSRRLAWLTIAASGKSFLAWPTTNPPTLLV